MKTFVIRYKNQLSLGVALAIIVLYVVFATYKLNLPAVHYDEALYVNAALGGVDPTTFITARIGDIPTLLMPYIGALKAWVFAPIFALFGTSAVSMRLPAVLLSAGALYMLFRFLKPRIGLALAAAVLGATAISTSFIVFTRLDLGPVVLDLLLKLAAIWLIVRFANKPKLHELALFWFVLAVGEFNKLNFLWYVMAFIVAFVVVYGRSIVAKLKPAFIKRAALISAIGLAWCVGYYLYITTTYNLSGNFGFVGFDLVLRNLQTMVDGSWFFNYALSTEPISSSIIFWFMAGVILVGCVLMLPKWRSKYISPVVVKLFAFFGLFLLALLVQMSITKAATAGWHYFSIFPMWQVLFVLAAYVTCLSIAQHKRRIALAATGAVVAVLGAWHLTIYSTYLQAYDKPTTNIGWSPALYDLLAFTKSQTNARFISLDWGIHVPLQALDPTANKYYEVFGPLNPNDPAQVEFVRSKYLNGGVPTYYVTHPESSVVFKDLDTNFLIIAANEGLDIKEAGRFYDSNGKAIFIVYKLNGL